MSIKVTSWVWENADASGSELLTLLALADRANDNGLCWPGIDSIAKKSRVTRRQARRNIVSLEKKGLLSVVRNHGRSTTNYYRIQMGDTGVPLSEDDLQEIAVANEAEKRTSKAEKGSPMTEKEVTDDPQYIRNHQEPPESIAGADSEPGSNKKNRERSNGSTRLSDFERWYAIYPRKVAKGHAERAWEKLDPDSDLAHQIIQATEHQADTVFRNAEPRYIPHPATWLNAKRWEDEVPESPAKNAQDSSGKDWYDDFLGEDAPAIEDHSGVIDADYRER